jgi:two-component system chemotaxis response regulator CheB
MPQIKALVVDDSALMRKVITNMLESCPDIKVIGRANNGQDAIEKVTRLAPDVVTMDIEMPVLDGLHALGYIMSECPTPVIMLSAASTKHADVIMSAFHYGAVDFIVKPSGNISIDLDRIKEELIEKVKAASRVKTHKLAFIAEKDAGIEKRNEAGEKTRDETRIHTLIQKNQKIVVIGTSTGGPRALHHVLTALPPGLKVPVLVVQHMPPGFTKSLAERLDSQSRIRIREAKEGDLIEPGLVLIAPGGFHMIVKQNKTNGVTREIIGLTMDEKVQGVRPSVDVLLNSVVPIYGENSLGVILTGMGSDGSEGIKNLKAAGGKVIVEDESTCVVYGMPRAVVNQNLADFIFPINKIAEGIMQNI